MKEKRTNISHGMSHTKFYKVWSGMIERCNPNNPIKAKFKHYSNKGIIVEPEWQDFGRFKKDMYAEYIRLTDEYEKNGCVKGRKPSIDRIDSNKNYCKSNCQWLALADNAKKDNVSSVAQFTANNELIAIYESAAEAARTATSYAGKSLSKSAIGRAISGKTKQAGGCIWLSATTLQVSEYSTAKDGWEFCEPVIAKTHDTRKYKVVVRIDPYTMKELSKHSSYITAYKDIKFQGRNFVIIKHACENGTLAAGYRWKYENDMSQLIAPTDKELMAETFRRNTFRKVSRYSSSGIVLEEFDSITEAGKSIDLKYHQKRAFMSACESGGMYGKSLWKFTTEFTDK